MSDEAVRTSLGCLHPVWSTWAPGPALLGIKLPAGAHPRRQQAMDDSSIGSLPPWWETWIEFWILCSGLAMMDILGVNQQVRDLIK